MRTSKNAPFFSDAASDVEIKKEGGGEENNGVAKEDIQPDPHDMLPKESISKNITF